MNFTYAGGEIPHITDNAELEPLFDKYLRSLHSHFGIFSELDVTIQNEPGFYDKVTGLTVIIDRVSNGIGERAITMPSIVRLTQFTLVPMPGCCGIVVSTHASVNSMYKNRGIGTEMNKFRQEIALLYGYTVMMCTDVETNHPQQRILYKNGWQRLYSFRNKRTGNDVAIHAIQL
jgi:hypothetical protein